MCINCNAGEAGTDQANAFLAPFAGSRTAMKDAADALHALLRTDLDPEHRRRYDRAHKHMVRLMREWNGIEEQREHGADA